MPSNDSSSNGVTHVVVYIVDADGAPRDTDAAQNFRFGVGLLPENHPVVRFMDDAKVTKLDGSYHPDCERTDCSTACAQLLAVCARFVRWHPGMLPFHALVERGGLPPLAARKPFELVTVHCGDVAYEEGERSVVDAAAAKGDEWARDWTARLHDAMKNDRTSHRPPTQLCTQLCLYDYVKTV